MSGNSSSWPAAADRAIQAKDTIEDLGAVGNACRGCADIALDRFCATVRLALFGDQQAATAMLDAMRQLEWGGQ